MEFLAIVVGSAVLGAGFLFVMNKQSQARVRVLERRKQAEHDWASSAVALLESMPEEGLEERLSAVAASWGALSDLYKPKKEEPVLGVLPVARIDNVTVVSSDVGFSGFTLSKQVVGPLKFRAGSMSVVRAKSTSRVPVGSGVLVVTRKRVLFAPKDGSAWSKTWAGLSNWQPTPDGVVLTPNNGKAIEFQLATNRDREPEAHPLFFIGVMDYASGSLEA